MTPRPPDEEAAYRRGLQEGLIRSFVGKKVSLSTLDGHHLVGWLVGYDADERLALRVRGREMHVRRAGLARLHEADPALAEYLK